MPEPVAPAIELKRYFRSLSEFTDFVDQQRSLGERESLFDDAAEERIVAHVLKHGVHGDFFGPIASHEVAIHGEETREFLCARGFSPRQRAMLDLTIGYLRERDIAEAQARILGHEAVTALALAFRGRFPRYIGTEYGPSLAEREHLFPITPSNVCRSEWPDGAFDLIMSADVLEHVPSIDRALADSARILRPGGRMIATFPFLFSQQDSVRFAELDDDGATVFLQQPIYHGNPVDPEGGSLVFEIPGWDIVGRVLRAGFADARILFWVDQVRGIVGSNLGSLVRPRGIFVAVFDR